jgi:hypothetical protein
METTASPMNSLRWWIILALLVGGTLGALGLIFAITPLSVLMMAAGPSGEGESSFAMNLVGFMGLAYALVAIIAPIAAWVMFFRRVYLWTLGLVLAPLGCFVVWLISFWVSLAWPS